jgi:two-component system cell cycle response regulator
VHPGIAGTADATDDADDSRLRAAFGAHRRSVCRDEICRASAVAGLGWLVMYQLCAWAASGTSMAPLVTDGLYLLPIGACAVVAVYAARASQGRIAVVWRWLAASNLCWLLGEVLWSVHVWTAPNRLVASTDTDMKSPVADLAFTLSYILLVPAAWYGFVQTRKLWRARAFLDASLVVLAVGSVGWRLMGTPDPAGSADLLSDLIYPALGLVFIIGLCSAGLAGHRGIPCSILLAMMGLGAGVVADSGYAVLDAGNRFTDASFVNLGWQAEAVLLVLAGVAAIRHPDLEPPPTRFDRDRAFGAVLVSGLVVAVLVGIDQIRNHKVETGWLVVTALVFVGLLARQVLTTRERTRLAKSLEGALREQKRTAVTDGLTGLHNRPFFQALLGVEARRALPGEGRAALILVDLDAFDQIYDHHGWTVGDTVLVQVADRLRTAARPGDVLARYGVEEFACLLPQTDEEAAMEVAERFRQALRRTPIAVSGADPVPVTGSFGVATTAAEPAAPADASMLLNPETLPEALVEPVLDMERLVRDADRALSDARERGGDRVVVAGRPGRRTLADDLDVPAELAWLADRVDRVLSDHEHSTAVARWCLLVGGYLALDHIELRQVVAAGRLHDIGKFAVGAAVLRKSDPLTDSEWGALRCHPDEGARLLRGVGGHAALAPLVAAHHERWDGLGYPAGLEGEAIPLGARIIAVCDSWAAMRVDRPYAPALDSVQARDEIEQARGTQFDPIVVDAFLALLDQDLIDDPAPL